MIAPENRSRRNRPKPPREANRTANRAAKTQRTPKADRTTIPTSPPAAKNPRTKPKAHASGRSRETARARNRRPAKDAANPQDCDQQRRGPERQGDSRLRARTGATRAATPRFAWQTGDPRIVRAATGKPTGRETKRTRIAKMGGEFKRSRHRKLESRERESQSIQAAGWPQEPVTT